MYRRRNEEFCLDMSSMRCLGGILVEVLSREVGTPVQSRRRPGLEIYIRESFS